MSRRIHTERESNTGRLIVRHGMSATPIYKVWEAMVHRCTNPNNKKWHLYGGRGITVCDRWRDFVNFYADMGPRPDGLTLDRIDTNGNYEPGNCRWATYSAQNANLRPRMTCRNGHPRTSENTYLSPTTGQRYCRECKRLRARKAVTS